MVLSTIVSICLGIFAALVVVFLTNKINRTNFVRLCVWSMVIGFAWRPVMDATSALTSKVTQNYLAAATKELAADTSNKSAELQPGLSAAEIKPKIDRTVASAVETVKSLPEVKDRKTQDQARQSLATTANQLKEVAVKSNDPAVAEKATEALKILGETAVETKSYGVANAVSKSLNEVVNNVPDKELKETAWTSKEKIDASNVPSAASSPH